MTTQADGHAVPQQYYPSDYASNREAAVDAIVAKISGEPARSVAAESSSYAATTLLQGEFAPLTPEEAYAEAQRIAAKDDGTVDYLGLSQNLQSYSKTLHAELTAHKFDPVTGQKIYDLVGPARENKARVLAQVVNQIMLQTFIAKAVERVRTERAAIKAAEDEVRAIRTDWTGGDARREKLLQDAIEQLEANDLAARLIKMRRAKKN